MAPKDAPPASGTDGMARAMMSLKKGFPEEAPPRMGQNYKGILGDDFAHLPLLKRLNWLHVPLLFSTPLIAMYGLYTTEKFIWQTWVFAVVYYFATGLGITAGAWRVCYRGSRRGVRIWPSRAREARRRSYSSKNGIIGCARAILCDIALTLPSL
jgi:hypothetical protein